MALKDFEVVNLSTDVLDPLGKGGGKVTNYLIDDLGPRNTQKIWQDLHRLIIAIDYDNTCVNNVQFFLLDYSVT